MRLAPLLLALLALDACATTDTAATQQPQASSDQTPRRRRRRRRHTDANGDIATMPTMGSTSSESPDNTASSASPSDSSASPSDPNASRSSFGSPLVNASQEVQVSPRWIVEDGHGHIECEGNDERPVPPPSPQCPQEPSNAAIVRAFVPLERETLACNPPANANGRLPMHVTFGAAGYPLEISFPGVRVLRRAATCMGRVLCGARVPNFRSSEATIDYEYVVLVPAAE